MRVIGHEIVRRDAPRGGGERAVDIALVAHDMTGPLRCRLELGAIGDRVVARIGAEIPADLEFLAALLRRPGVGGNDRNAAQRIEPRGNRSCGDLHHLLDTRHFESVRGVEGQDLAAIDWAALDRRIFHSRQHDIDAVGRLAAHHVLEIDDWNWFADVTTVVCRLEPQLHVVGRRYLQGRGDLRSIAEWQLPSSRDVNDHVIARAAVVGVDAPDMRRGGLEHLPRRGARLAHRLIELPHAARSVGVLIAVFRVALGLDDLHAVPVGFELVGEHHRQSGLDSGAHLGAVRDNRHQPGVIDHQVDVGLKCRRSRGLGCRHRNFSKTDIDAEHETGSGHRASHDIPPAQIHDRGHQITSVTDLIAARIRR